MSKMSEMNKSERERGRVKLERETRETRVELELALRGSGRASLDVELFFLRHMLETLAVHARLDLKLNARGDDEHHLVEDVALALGAALRRGLDALGSVERFGHAVVPMDDALVLVALDLMERPYAQIELPYSIWAHFLRSLALEGRFTLHVRKLAGCDEHHVVEAAFKALGRALRAALRPPSSSAPSSTKGEVRWS